MSREIGSRVLAGNFEVRKKAPIDARTLVSTYASLLSFTGEDEPYNGMLVSVLDSDSTKAGVWRLINENDLSNPSSWEKLGTGSGSGGDTYNNTYYIVSGGTAAVAGTFYLGVGGETSFTKPELSGKTVALVTRSGVGYEIIPSGTPNEYQVRYDIATSTFTFNQAIEPNEPFSILFEGENTLNPNDFIQNQSGATQSANFKINGVGTLGKVKLTDNTPATGDYDVVVRNKTTGLLELTGTTSSGGGGDYVPISGDTEIYNIKTFNSQIVGKSGYDISYTDAIGSTFNETHNEDAGIVAKTTNFNLPDGAFPGFVANRQILSYAIGSQDTISFTDTTSLDARIYDIQSSRDAASIRNSFQVTTPIYKRTTAYQATDGGFYVDSYSTSIIGSSHNNRSTLEVSGTDANIFASFLMKLRPPTGGTLNTVGLQMSAINTEQNGITSSQALFRDDVNLKGLEYAGDYESNFSARSLVTKKYVDDVIASVGESDSGTTENYVPISGDTIIYDNKTFDKNITVSGLTIGAVGGSFVFGKDSLKHNTGSYNVGIGLETLSGNTSGSGNIGIGYRALWKNSTSGSMVAIGSQTLSENTTGSVNTAVGNQALQQNSTGSLNTAVGHTAMYGSVTGSSNTAVGYAALYNNKGSKNTGIGISVLRNNTGVDNVAIGINILESNTGEDNIGIGSNALSKNTYGWDNIGIGRSSLTTNTSGAHNIAIGQYSLYESISGSYNIAMGYTALTKNTTGGSNIALGYASLSKSVDTDNNVAIGSQSMSNRINGSYNVGIGSSSLSAQSGGTYNVAIGPGALSSTGVTNYSVAIGAYAGWNRPNEDYKFYLGVGFNSTNVKYLLTGDFLTGQLTLPVQPFTSVGTYDILTRNKTTGAIESISSTGLTGGGGSPSGDFVPYSGADKTVNLGSQSLSGNSMTATTDSYIAGMRIGTFNNVTTRNTVVGYNALAGLTTGQFNTAIGYEAGKGITNGWSNTAVGVAALGSVLATGSQNVAVGSRALISATSAGNNVVVGYSTMEKITTGSWNTALGNFAGGAVTTGVHNVFIGAYAGYNESGNYKFILSSAGGDFIDGRLITGDFSTGEVEVPRGNVELSTANKGIILKSPNGTRYKITVSDAGVLSVTPA